MKVVNFWSIGILSCGLSIGLALQRINEDQHVEKSAYVGSKISETTLAALNISTYNGKEVKYFLFPPSCQSCSLNKFPDSRALDSRFTVITVDRIESSPWCTVNNCLPYAEFHLDPDVPIHTSTILIVREGVIVKILEHPEEIIGAIGK